MASYDIDWTATAWSIHNRKNQPMATSKAKQTTLPGMGHETLPTPLIATLMAVVERTHEREIAQATAQTWLVNGKPGLVLAALASAQRDVDSVEKRTADNDNDTMRWQDADEIVVVGKQALAAQGLVFSLQLVDPLILDTGRIAGKYKDPVIQMSVRAVLDIIHPVDGSGVSFTATGLSIVNGMGKYGSACNTAARKQVWQAALGITTGETNADHAPKYEPPEWVEFMIADMRALDSKETLRAYVGGAEYQASKGDDREMLKAVAMRRLDELNSLLPDDIEALIAELQGCQTKAAIREVTGTAAYLAVRGHYRPILHKVGMERLNLLLRLGERDGNAGAIEPSEFKRPQRAKGGKLTDKEPKT
jgi:hypothetical protein